MIMSEFDLGFLVGMGVLMFFAILIAILLVMLEWFDEVNYAKKRIKELDDEIDFDKLIEDYSKESYKEC